jgi:hypothetical protein
LYNAQQYTKARRDDNHTGISIYLSSGCKPAIDGLGGKELKLFLVSKLVLSSYLAMKFAKNYII